MYLLREPSIEKHDSYRFIFYFLFCSNFVVESYPGYGNCFIFNSKINKNDSLAGKRTLALTGPTFGLSLVLNLNQKYYLKKGATQKVSKYFVNRFALRIVTFMAET